MKYHFLLLIILIIVGCSGKNKDQQGNQTDTEYSEPDEPKYDTILARQEFENFVFFIMAGREYSYDNVHWTRVYLKTREEYFNLGDIHSVHRDEKLIHVYGDYYMFPHWSGGNYSRASGFHVSRISRDTAFYMGLVCGYGDVDGDGTKEFFYNDVVEFGEANAFNVIEEFPCEIVNDSIIYPTLFESY